MFDTDLLFFFGVILAICAVAVFAIWLLVTGAAKAFDEKNPLGHLMFWPGGLLIGAFFGFLMMQYDTTLPTIILIGGIVSAIALVGVYLMMRVKN